MKMKLINYLTICGLVLSPMISATTALASEVEPNEVKSQQSEKDKRYDGTVTINVVDEEGLPIKVETYPGWYEDKLDNYVIYAEKGEDFEFETPEFEGYTFNKEKSDVIDYTFWGYDENYTLVYNRSKVDFNITYEVTETTYDDSDFLITDEVRNELAYKNKTVTGKFGDQVPEDLWEYRINGNDEEIRTRDFNMINSDETKSFFTSNSNIDLKYQIHTVGVNVYYNDNETGEELSPAYRSFMFYGDPYEFFPKDIDNYRLVDTIGETSGVADYAVGPMFLYAKLFKQEIKLIDEVTGEKIGESIFVEGIDGEELTVDLPYIAGYSINEQAINITINGESSSVTPIIANYTPDPEPIKSVNKINIVDEEGNKIKIQTPEGLFIDNPTEYEVVGNFFDPFVFDLPTFEGYTFNESLSDKLPTELTQQDGEYTLVYNRKTINYNINYNVTNTTYADSDYLLTDEIKNSLQDRNSTISGKYGEELPEGIWKQNISGVEGELSRDYSWLNNDSAVDYFTEDKDIELNYSIHTVITGLHFLDAETGEELLESKQGYMFYGDFYNFEPEVIEGYRLVRTEGRTEGQADYAVGATFYYSKLLKQEIKMIDKDTKEEISDKMFIEGIDGETLTFDSPIIEGYTSVTPDIQFTVNKDTTESTPILIEYVKDEEPTVPVDPTDPVDPVDPTDPVDPKPIEPVTPNPVNPTTPNESKPDIPTEENQQKETSKVDTKDEQKDEKQTLGQFGESSSILMTVLGSMLVGVSFLFKFFKN